MDEDVTYEGILDVTFWGSCALFLLVALAALRVQRATEEGLPAWLREFFGKVPPGRLTTLYTYELSAWAGWGTFAVLELAGVMEIYGQRAFPSGPSLVPSYVGLRYDDSTQVIELLAVAVFVVPALFFALWGIFSASRALLLLQLSLRSGEPKLMRRHQGIPVGAFTDEFHWLLRNLRAAILLWGLAALFGITVFMFVRDSYEERVIVTVVIGAILVLYHVFPMVLAASVLTGTVREFRTELTIRMGKLRKDGSLALLAGRYGRAAVLDERAGRIAELLDKLPPGKTSSILARHWWRSLALTVPPVLALLSPTIATIVERIASGL